MDASKNEEEQDEDEHEEDEEDEEGEEDTADQTVLQTSQIGCSVDDPDQNMVTLSDGTQVNVFFCSNVCWKNKKSQTGRSRQISASGQCRNQMCILVVVSSIMSKGQST